MEMKVHKSANFVIQELAKNSFEYKMIETAFIKTSEPIQEKPAFAAVYSTKIVRIEKCYNV